MTLFKYNGVTFNPEHIAYVSAQGKKLEIQYASALAGLSWTFGTPTEAEKAAEVFTARWEAALAGSNKSP